MFGVEFMKKKENLKREKTILLIFLGIFLFLVVPILGVVAFYPKFHIQEFQNKVQVNANDSFQPMSGKVCYGNLFSCKEVEYETKGEVDTQKIGEYEITYIYQHQGKELSKTQIVQVVDLEGPSLEIIEGEYYYCPNGNVPNYEVTSYDNLDKDVSSLVKKEGKDGKIIFSVVDSSGNETKKEVDAIEKDEEAPSLTLNGEETIYLKVNETYQEQGATATDNCDGDLTSQIVISGEVNTSTPGEYQVQYSITDQKGNQTSKTRKVFVYANNNYGTPNGKSIYLTFDDGPGPYTSKLLDILKKYQVPATFFVTDQGLTKGYDSIILRAYQEGHTIGLHSSSHSYGIYTNETTYFNDLYAIQEKVKRITGETSQIIRFPGGSSNTVSKSYDGGSKIMSQLTKAVEAKGFRYFDWNVSSGDAGETTSTSKVVTNVIQGLNGSTSMVLQHDIKSFSVDAVEAIIQYGLSHGYTFRKITMDTPTVHHHVNN